MVRSWLLHSVGMLPCQIRNALRYVASARTLLNASDAQLTKWFALSNHMHKRKLRLAIDCELRSSFSSSSSYHHHPLTVHSSTTATAANSKYPARAARLSSQWVSNVWLRQLGLVQLQSVFAFNLIDGRLLATMQRKDLDKHLGISKRHVQTSLLLGIELLRSFEFDVERLDAARSRLLATQRRSVVAAAATAASGGGMSVCDMWSLELSLWTNESFGDWLRLVNLQAFAGNLSQSGLHGPFVGHDAFNVDMLYACLSVPVDEAKYTNMKKIIDGEIRLLRRTAAITNAPTATSANAATINQPTQR